MANSKNDGSGHKYATVDTAPANDSGGYFTSVVTPRSEKIDRFYFSIRETSPDSSASSVTVKLQYKCSSDADWTDILNNGEDWAIGDRVAISDYAAGVQYRAGVKDNSDYTSGSVTFGFDW